MAKCLTELHELEILLRNAENDRKYENFQDLKATMVTATRMVVDTEIQLRVLKLAHCALGKLRLQTYRRNAVDTITWRWILASVV